MEKWISRFKKLKPILERSDNEIHIDIFNWIFFIQLQFDN